MKKIGIYSGTFDPIHNGHIAFATETAELYGIDKIFFLPEPRPRRKQGVKAFEHRIKMVNLAIKDNEKLGLITIEQARFTPQETMPILRNRFEGTELYMLMGDDLLEHFIDWPSIEELTANMKFIIGIRKYSENHIKQVMTTIEEVKNTKLQAHIFKPSSYELSSAELKKCLRQNKKPLGLHESVEKYIRVNNLYSTGEK
ncbi:nicotinate-nicotinamide nucleotide adenylyltransferase [Candidatus Saccharibacteria bacterium]|nr:nicotinate-nicotinamide nucleotide adenylyltransferase [Candidatus Saccharibacteria bacterium]